ncbi:Sec63 domain, partial [Trinorchestia longiramus]
FSVQRKYEQLVTGSGALESHLHQNLIEHLNAEIVLGTIDSVDVAVTWLQSTFLYVRAQNNPRHYGFPAQLPNLLNKFSELCRHEVSLLDRAGLVVTEERGSLAATPLGALMARYCVSFRSMNTMLQVSGDESFKELLTLITECHEFSDVKLRTSEKRSLNDLNKKKKGDERGSCVRFPVPGGKIKNGFNKIFCLVQAVFGCLPLNDPGLSQEANKIIRVGLRLSKCLREVVSLRGSTGHLEAQLNAVLLSKCFACGLWENSPHVVRQLDRIGPTLATALANSRITSFTALENANPRDIEMVCRR